MSEFNGNDEDVGPSGPGEGGAIGRREFLRNAVIATATGVASDLMPGRSLARMNPSADTVTGPARVTERVSRPGEYSGYSEKLYDGYQLTSRYVTVRDGTKLAIDIVRPTLGGSVVDKKLPTVWMNTPYNRRRVHGGTVAGAYPGAALALVNYGYVVAVADMRGNYASFGKAIHTNRNEWIPWAYWDAYDLTEWLAAQPWCDGNVGMWGCSATGHSQWQAVATRPPHLKAVFPLSAPSEYYDWGGITRIYGTPPPVPHYPGPIPERDATAVPVDGRDGEKLLGEAKEEHRWNLPHAGPMPFRNSSSPWLLDLLGWKDFKYWLVVNTFTHLKDIGESGIPAYQSANFGEDMRVKLGVMVKLRNLKNAKKLVLGPGPHCTWSTGYEKRAANPFNITAEEHRWFDYWLKGVDNGVMDEPPIYYYAYNLEPQGAWQFAWQWPLPTARSVKYYFGPPQGDLPSSGANDGSLCTSAPTSPSAKDVYTVDYDVTVENENQKGLTYTTAPLESNATMVGHPVVRLWISSTATDGDFVAFLFDVAPDGGLKQLPGIYDGRLRASHRRLNTPPYDNLGLPYHRSYREDIEPLTPGEPTELVFDMAPISYIFKAGHRIRLIISCVVTPRLDNPGTTPVLSPPPVVSFYRNAMHSSHISLPLNGPIEATGHVKVNGNVLAAYLSFPESMDSRYLQDIKTDSISCNGTRAIRAQMDGGLLVAEFPSSASGRGGSLEIQGAFGRKYHYGPWMTFVSRIRAA